MGTKKTEIVFASIVDSVVDPDPELFAGSELGSGINHFGSGSGQSGSGMNLKPNFSVEKSHFLNQVHKKLEYLAHIYESDTGFVLIYKVYIKVTYKQ
jgi:hypothetical protein